MCGPDLVHSIGRLLKARREELGLSRRELADRAGVRQSAIARVEAGGRGISLGTVQRLAKALGVELVARLS